MTDLTAARAAAERALALILAGRSPQTDDGAMAALARYVLVLAEEVERLRAEQASDHSDVGEDYEDEDMPRGWWLVIMIFCGGILAALIGLVMWRLR